MLVSGRPGTFRAELISNQTALGTALDRRVALGNDLENDLGLFGWVREQPAILSNLYLQNSIMIKIKITFAKKFQSILGTVKIMILWSYDFNGGGQECHSEGRECNDDGLWVTPAKIGNGKVMGR